VLASRLAQAQAPSQCVDCHRGLPEQSQAGHSFAVWGQSQHAAAGVRCEACHGGDPAAADRIAAHRGVRRSSDRNSPVYYTRIPQTCGRCHASQLAYFRSSVHYARLESDGRGPNCVTCHGAMATSVLSAAQVLGTCAACHSPGGVAGADRARSSAPVLALVQAEQILYEVVRQVAGRSPGAEGASARARLASAQRHLRAAAEVWHNFRLDSAAQRLTAAEADVVAAWVALGNRAPSARRDDGASPRSPRP
jgi:mono/diheme cytochrome c family protein